MAKQLIQEEASAKFCSFYLPAFSLCSFLNRTSFRRTILSPVYFTWVVDVTRICFGEFLLKHYIVKKGMERIIPLELCEEINPI